MRTGLADELEMADREELLTTGEVAILLGSSRQHVVDLCDAGLLPYVTTGRHRRIRRRDVEAARTRTHQPTRDQRRSAWLNMAVAGKLVADPDGVLAKAHDNLKLMSSRHQRGQGARWLREWENLLNGPVERVLEALTSPAPRARELRQNSPFGGVLSEQERLRVLDKFRAHDRSGGQ